MTRFLQTIKRSAASLLAYLFSFLCCLIFHSWALLHKVRRLLGGISGGHLAGFYSFLVFHIYALFLNRRELERSSIGLNLIITLIVLFVYRINNLLEKSFQIFVIIIFFFQIRLTIVWSTHFYAITEKY